MDTKTITELLSVATTDIQGNVEVLKKSLADNDYKICSDSARIMLSEMVDMGMPQDARFYWEAIATLHLPQHPLEALKVTA